MSNKELKTPELSNLEKELLNETTPVQPRRTFWQSLGDFYFKPKSFEKSGKIYEMLGVTLFSKYWINGGSYWTRKDQSPMVKGRKKEDLESYISTTHALEKIHLALLPFYFVPTALCLTGESYGAAVLTVGANVAVNLYPIMSQRYNRNRAIKLVERINRNALDSHTPQQAAGYAANLSLRDRHF